MMSPTLKLLTTTILSAAMLTACGGGSSGGSSTDNSDPGGSSDNSPIVNAGSDQSVAELETVQLSATASDADGDAISYAWTQTFGTPVSLSSTTVSNPTFLAPDLTATETLEFSIAVTANNVQVSDEVSITVSDFTLPDYAANFEATSLASDLEVVPCTVGTVETTCLSVVLKSSPGGTYTVGPFCPRATADTADEGGIWIKSDGDTVYEVSGNFITTLNTEYDSTWQLYDANTGEVFFTEGDECQLAANPTPDPSLANHCVECLVSDLAAGLIGTYLIPTSPVETGTVTQNTSYGVTFSGTLLDQSAPLNLIESNNNIAPFDDCGGHINPNVGYHTHAVTDGCFIEVDHNAGHAAQIGLALDGYPIFERLNGTTEPTGLDSCRGISASTEGYDLGDIDYHYHVNPAGSNQILPCLTGQVVGGGNAGGPPNGGPPN